jgi:hypothetical protein
LITHSVAAKILARVEKEMVMDGKPWVEAIVAATLPITVIALILHRIITRKGIGVRAIQFLGVSLGVPVIAPTCV